MQLYARLTQGHLAGVSDGVLLKVCTQFEMQLLPQYMNGTQRVHEVVHECTCMTSTQGCVGVMYIGSLYFMFRLFNYMFQQIQRRHRGTGKVWHVREEGNTWDFCQIRALYLKTMWEIVLEKHIWHFWHSWGWHMFRWSMCERRGAGSSGNNSKRSICSWPLLSFY